jgi:hypothetical protein
MSEWFSCQVVVRGFVAGETDFATRFARLIQGERDYLTTLVDRIATVESAPASFLAITTLGYSDRVDEAGLSAEQRRTKEDDAAQARAESASAWLRDQLVARFAGTSFDGLSAKQWRGLAAMKVGAGASRLVHPAPGTSEALRRQNRRVAFLVYSFQVPGFAADNEVMELG